VATAVLDDDQALFVATVPLHINWVVFPIQALNVPVMVGNPLIVIIAVT
jgi:hypothetical protein